jgi:hypothetical protein
MHPSFHYVFFDTNNLFDHFPSSFSNPSFHTLLVKCLNCLLKGLNLVDTQLQQIGSSDHMKYSIHWASLNDT